MIICPNTGRKPWKCHCHDCQALRKPMPEPVRSEASYGKLTVHSRPILAKALVLGKDEKSRSALKRLLKSLYGVVLGNGWWAKYAPESHYFHVYDGKGSHWSVPAEAVANFEDTAPLLEPLLTVEGLNPATHPFQMLVEKWCTGSINGYPVQFFVEGEQLWVEAPQGRFRLG